MTTTTSPPTESPADEAEPTPCPKCKAPMKEVPDTDVKHCDACGHTEGEAVAPSSVADPGGEVVRTTTTTVEVRAGDAARGEEELDAATHEALMGVNPIPDRDQFLTMAATARMLSQSTAAPPAMRDPYVAFHVVMMGRALNLDPATAMNLIDAIGYDKQKQAKDQNIQLSLSPELLVARVQMMGLGSVELLWATKTRAEAVALLPGGRVVRATKNAGDVKIGDVIEIHGEKGRVTFDWDMAEEAELTDDRCVWDSDIDVVVHWKKVNTNGRGWSNNTPNGCRCGSYKKHPGRMMGWRAMGFAVHTYFSQASLGLYSPEELGAAVDEDGRAIDVTSVELPEGYTSAATNNVENEGGTPADDAATEQQISDIRWRTAQLPEAHRNDFMERWTDMVKEGRLTPVGELRATKVALGTALLQGAESAAKKDGWEAPEYPEDVVAAWADLAARRHAERVAAAGGTPEAPEGAAERPAEAQDGPEGTGAPPTPAEGVAASEGQPGGQGGETPGAPEASGDRTEVERTRALALQLGQALPVPTDSVLDLAIARVRGMTVRQLNAALRERKLAVDKIAENVRRQTLAKAIAQELADVDWREANGVAPDPA